MPVITNNTAASAAQSGEKAEQSKGTQQADGSNEVTGAVIGLPDAPADLAQMAGGFLLVLAATGTYLWYRKKGS